MINIEFGFHVDPVTLMDTLKLRAKNGADLDLVCFEECPNLFPSDIDMLVDEVPGTTFDWDNFEEEEDDAPLFPY